MKLAVCYAWSSPFMFTDFVDSSLNMTHPESCEVRYFRGAGWCPAKRHINMCEAAIDWGADLVCTIGSDQVHPQDMLCRLIARWWEGYEVIAAMVPCRGYTAKQDMKPFQPMAWRFKPNLPGDTTFREYRGMALDRDMIEVVKREDGDMQMINFIGTGVLLFHRDHLLALEKPWFYEKIEYEEQQRISCMDSVFVWRLQSEARATVWVDTTIKVKHSHVFQIDDTFQDRFTDWAIPNQGDPNVCVFRNQK